MIRENKKTRNEKKKKKKKFSRLPSKLYVKERFLPLLCMTLCEVRPVFFRDEVRTNKQVYVVSQPAHLEVFGCASLYEKFHWKHFVSTAHNPP